MNKMDKPLASQIKGKNKTQISNDITEKVNIPYAEEVSKI